MKNKIWVNGTNDFNKNSFNEMCGLLRRGERIEDEAKKMVSGVCYG